MNDNELGLLVKDIPKDDLDLFLKKTTAETIAKEDIDKVTLDYSWVDVLDESIPYLDNIIRNPRRFIVSEEDIVPIEKTKKVGEESIKHLATHTQLIQDVDRDGMVKPIKLLNVFKEETIDLYENRFIYSLINNLYAFVRNQLTYQDDESSNKSERTISYNGKANYNHKNINISLSLVAKDQDSEAMDEEILAARTRKINHIKEVLEDFKASKFMLAMSNATPVRSPIRKTNVILKEQNFIKALSLWEFLENYQIKKPVKQEKVNKNLLNNELEHNLGMTFFVNYCLLTDTISKKGVNLTPVGTSLTATVLEYAKKFSVDENKLQKELNDIIKEASLYKEEQVKGIKNAYKIFLDGNKSRFNKALLLFK